METTIPCRGCGTILNLSDTGCPICLRGRTPQEIARGYVAVRERAARRRRRPFVVIATLAVVGAIGYSFYTLQAPIHGFIGRESARFGRFYDRNSAPAFIASDYSNAAPSAASAQTNTPPPTPVLPPPPASARVLPPEPAPPALPTPKPAAPRTPIAAAAEPALPHVPPSEWILHGRVRDLSTLKPLADLSLRVKMGAMTYSVSRSDAEGYYSFVLPRVQSDNSGYTLENADPRYATAAQYEGDIPYRQLSAADREQLIQNAQDDSVQSSPLADIMGQEDVRRDVFLSPRLADQ